MRLHDLLVGIDVTEWSGDPDVEVTTVTHDSRLVVDGSCFCCIPGATTDGHHHADEAVRAGARALIVERLLPLDVVQVRVPRVRAILGPVAASAAGHPSQALRVIGVTGTNGKTTVTYLLEAIGRAAGDHVGVIGTTGARFDGHVFESLRTTPEAPEFQQLLARMRDAGVGTVAVEVSSHALVQHRVDATTFASVCFTNLSHEHLDFHGTLEHYFDAKATLFDPRFTQVAACNIDDPAGKELVGLAESRGLEVFTFGASEHARFQALHLVMSDGYSTFELVDTATGDRGQVRLSLVGRFNVANALAAAAVARAGGISFEAVVAGLSAHVVVPGRLEAIGSSEPISVLVDYAHTPEALALVLDTARSISRSGRVIVVFGCGGDRDREKRPLMGAAAAAGADYAVITADNSRSESSESIIEMIMDGWRGGTPFLIETDRRAAIRAALVEARVGDAVVIAGKGHEATQTANGVTVVFDDRDVAREELEALGCA